MGAAERPRAAAANRACGAAQVDAVAPFAGIARFDAAARQPAGNPEREPRRPAQHPCQ